MSQEVLYKEKQYFFLAIIIFGVVILALLFLFFYQMFVEPIGSKPIPTLYLIPMILFFGFITWIFKALEIVIYDDRIVVSFSFIKRTIFWDNIDILEVDGTLSIKYFGWGIRLVKLTPNFRLVFNLPNRLRLLITLKKGKIKEFSFSTKNPEQVFNAIRNKIILLQSD